MEPVNLPAHRWPCARLKCVSGLRRLEKTLKFLRCIHVIDLVLKYDSDIKEENWLQLLLLLCIDWFSCLRYWNEFFSAVFHVLD